MLLAWVRMSVPKTYAEPADGGQNPRSVLIKVDLPAPFGPSKPMVRPVKEQVKSRSTSRFPSRTERPRNSMIGGPPGLGTGVGLPATEGRTVDVSLTCCMIQFRD